MTVDSNVSLPLWLLYEDEVEAWRAAQRRRSRAGWRSRISRARGIAWCCCRMPRAASRRRSAAWASGRESCRLWHAAGFAERLPPRRFHLAQAFTADEATQLCLGFAYGAYRFDRYRAAKTEAASVEAPPNADMQFVALAAESLRMARDWINTPAADFGPAELAAAARQLAERHQADYQGVGGRGVARGKFSGHSCRGPRQRRSAAAGRTALGAARAANPIRA